MADPLCFERIYGDQIGAVERTMLIAALILYALDPFICYFAIPATWTNFLVIAAHLYGGLGLVLRRFMGWRYKQLVSISAIFGIEVALCVFQALDFVFLCCNKMV